MGRSARVYDDSIGLTSFSDRRSMVPGQSQSFIRCFANGPSRRLRCCAATPLRRLVALCLCATLAATAVAQVSPSHKNDASFTLSGSVVNSVTGESVGHALVRINGTSQRTVFADGEGHFQVEGMQAG